MSSLLTKIKKEKETEKSIWLGLGTTIALLLNGCCGALDIHAYKPGVGYSHDAEGKANEVWWTDHSICAHYAETIERSFGDPATIGPMIAKCR